MADRSGLKLVGFIFATVTAVVMLTAAMVVKGYADGEYRLEPRVVAIGKLSTRQPTALGGVLGRASSNFLMLIAPDQRQRDHS
jgi:hypothetical protein